MQYYEQEFLDKLEKQPIYIKAVELHRSSMRVAENMFINYRNHYFYIHSNVEELVKSNETLILHIQLLEKLREYKELSQLNEVFSILYKLRNSAEKIARIYNFCHKKFPNESKKMVMPLLVINEFRILFIDWIKFFNKYWESEDKWGLTNPILQFPENEDVSLKDGFYGSDCLNL